MAGNRSYGEQCGVARSLDVIGERWAVLIVRELLLGPKRFNDLLAGLPGASPNVISQRLRELVGDGVIAQRELPPPARVRVYELTGWGRELEPVVVHLGRWGGRAPLPEGAHAGLDSVLVAIQATADPARVTGRYQLRVGADTFAIDGTSGTVRIRRGAAEQPDATATIDPDAFFSLVLGQRPVTDAIGSGDLRLDGSPDAVGRLTDLMLALVAAAPQALDAAGDRTPRPSVDAGGPVLRPVP